MKIVLDSCVWGPVAEKLREHGHDVVWTGDWDNDPGDDYILGYTKQQKRVLINLDKDFGELAVLHDREHHGILRVVRFSARQQGEVCRMILSSTENCCRQEQ